MQRSGAADSSRLSRLDSSSTSSSHESLAEEFDLDGAPDDEDVQDEAMLRRNDSPGSHRPIAIEERDEDVEQGVVARGSDWRVRGRASPFPSWQSITSFFGGRRTPTTDVDRDR
jgi:hypothetical protein